MKRDDLDLIVVGGGPAGMMAGLLFARAGCRVHVFEKHADFFRDFRGDTVHPSTMEILDQLGMLDRFLECPHHKLHKAQFRLGGRLWTIGDLSRLKTVAAFGLIMPQWDFLDFLKREAERFPGFSLAMDCPVENYIQDNGRVTGVELCDGRRFHSRLVIAADGRHSFVRKLLPLQSLAVPIDIFWFNVAKSEPGGVALRAGIERERVLVMIDRDDCWQCALLIPKGKAPAVLAGGIESVKVAIQSAAPELDLSSLSSVDDLHLLRVTLDRLRRWSKPGLLAVGDAAHAMSPIGGIGISLAIQDAVAAANLLAGPLARNQPVDALLEEVRRRRIFPTRAVQAIQKLLHDKVFAPILRPGPPIRHMPLAVRMIDRWPLLQALPAHIVGLGIRRERVNSPYDPARAKRASTEFPFRASSCSTRLRPSQ